MTGTRLAEEKKFVERVSVSRNPRSKTLWDTGERDCFPTRGKGGEVTGPVWSNAQRPGVEARREGGRGDVDPPSVGVSKVKGRRWFRKTK